MDTNKLTLIDGLGYALDEIKVKINDEEWQAFSKWFNNRPPYISLAGTKCVHASDLQLYIRLRANALKSK